MSRGVILVTGGSRGIGREVVKMLSEGPWRVAFTFRQDQSGAQQLEADLKGVRGYSLDLADPRRTDELVSEIDDQLGPISGLVSNAGYQHEALLAMTSDEQWHQTIDVNLRGAFRLCRAVLPRMIARSDGSIVLVSSLAAVRGVAGLGAYSAAKAGLLGLTRSLAREVGRRNIRINAVLPGLVQTDFTAHLSDTKVQQLRAAECLPGGVPAEQVAEAIRFLLSPASASITGQALHVDAGASA